MNLLRASMKIETLLTILLLLSAAPSQAQTDPAEVKAILSQSLEPRDVVTFQLQQFLLKRVPKLPAPASAAEWNMQEQRLAITCCATSFFTGGRRHGFIQRHNFRTWD